MDSDRKLQSPLSVEKKLPSSCLAAAKVGAAFSRTLFMQKHRKDAFFRRLKAASTLPPAICVQQNQEKIILRSYFQTSY